MAGISQKCFSHLIFSLGSQAPFADTEETAKLYLPGISHSSFLFPYVKELKNKKFKKEGGKKPLKTEQLGSTTLKTFSLLPQPSPLTTQTLWMLRQRRRGGHPYKIFTVQLPGWCQAEMEPAQK